MSKNRIIVPLVAIALLVSITVIVKVASMAVSRPCLARETSIGVFTTSTASSAVSAKHFGAAYGTVEDNKVDGINPAAHFKVIVDGTTVGDYWIGVPDGGSVNFSYNADYVSRSLTSIAEGYIGIRDSSASATAYWALYCPTCGSIAR